MAFEIVKLKSIDAGADLRLKQYTFVSIDNTGRLVNSGNGATAVGVLQDKPNLAQPGAICAPGDVTKVVAGAAVAAGAAVSSDAAGLAVTAVSGAFILGYNLAGAAGASGDVISIVFEPRGSKL